MHVLQNILSLCLHWDLKINLVAVCLEERGDPCDLSVALETLPVKCSYHRGDAIFFAIVVQYKLGFTLNFFQFVYVLLCVRGTHTLEQYSNFR